ncbi:uncharacterized protein LOC114332598 isoform X4 [Diabrotica virgifera virgifera]|uniref:Uncharacterized protein n=1 Tax=Diabrotica virgifera virgifera TaxID=50390 RepID=A0ABM5JL45_DIAVI|nr:uncharacterized protein LOC114332598 isoform X4 [Diabrotica virgifera virgifera]
MQRFFNEFFASDEVINRSANQRSLQSVISRYGERSRFLRLVDKVDSRTDYVMMDRRKFYKKVISEFSQVRAKRKLSFEDEIASNPTQEQQSSELTSLLDNNQPLTSIENMGDHVSSSRIFYKNHQSISKLEVDHVKRIWEMEKCIQKTVDNEHFIFF